MAYLKAQHYFERDLAHDFLVKLLREGHKFDSKKWEDALSQLDR